MILNVLLYCSRCCAVQMGIVGMPNVGKSTLFNVLTKMGIPAENFPFCTIEPNQVCTSSSVQPIEPALQEWQLARGSTLQGSSWGARAHSSSHAHNRCSWTKQQQQQQRLRRPPRVGASCRWPAAHADVALPLPQLLLLRRPA
jgi:hypothetical protein